MRSADQRKDLLANRKGAAYNKYKHKKLNKTIKVHLHNQNMLIKKYRKYSIKRPS